ncbi:transposase [Candidatus Enterovibrio escicola]|uniref:transposase n=1 Tax=Candidatus Enterovibrio escicola TaxID=1927127 RepID=UPI003C1302B3
MLRYQVFKGAAKREKGTLGWFYGLKLYLIINDRYYFKSKSRRLTWMIESLCRKWLTSSGRVYTETKVISLIHWSRNS